MVVLPGGALDRLRRISQLRVPGGLGATPCISVCGFLINGANADFARFQQDVRRASTIFEPCGSQVVEGPFQIVNDPTLLDHPAWECTVGLSDSARDMFGMAGTCGAGNIVMFYIRSMGGGLVGCGGPGLARGRPGFVSTDFGSGNGFAHELGHCFLGGNAAHSPDTTNVMFKTPSNITVDPPQVTAAQCMTINANQLVHKCGPIPRPTPVEGPVRLRIPPVQRLAPRAQMALLAMGAVPSAVRESLLAAEEGDLEPVVGLGQAVVPELIMLVAGDPDPVVRTRAAAALGRIGGSAAIQALAGSARTDANPIVRLTAAHTLGRIAGPAAQMVLMDLLRDPDAGVRITAMRALRAVQSPMSRMVIAQVARQDPNPQVRALALRMTQGPIR